MARSAPKKSVISAATIQSVLSSRFRITGLQATEARELALLLRSGALAAPQTHRRAAFGRSEPR